MVCYIDFIRSRTMKDKFSIYSPTYQKPREQESSIAFKKSPIKFAVY